MEWAPRYCVTIRTYPFLLPGRGSDGTAPVLSGVFYRVVQQDHHQTAKLLPHPWRKIPGWISLSSLYPRL